MKLEEFNEQERMTVKQAQKQRQLDVLACHQLLEASKPDAKVCIVYEDRRNISWSKAGDELCETLGRLDRNNDCCASIAEFKEERLNENYVVSIKVFYIRLPKTEKFNPSTAMEGKNIILEYCKENELPTPSVIVYDGNEYCLKWILREPLSGSCVVGFWKTVQKFLAERFFCLLDDRYYLEDGNSPKKKFAEAHSNVTVMLRIPGFQNSQTKGVDLFNPKFETRVIFSSEARYSTGEVAVKLHLSMWEIDQYRRAKEFAGGYLKKSPTRKKNQPDEASAIPAEIPVLDEALIASMKSALATHHNPREDKTFIYVQRKNVEKHSRTDRSYYYDSYQVSELERFVRRTDINICDFWATAAEYKFGFYKLKEKIIHRTKENGEQYEETRRQLPKREKWIEAIQLNFLHLNFRKSELGYIPTVEQAKELLYVRCEELNLPKPVIVDTGDNGETLELRWLWQNAMKNCGERDDESIRYPKFNRKFDAMQERLFLSFWDFGVDEKKLSATSMLCVVGTPNTKTGNLRSVFCEADEILTYQELAQRLGLNFAEADEEQKVDNLAPSEQQEPKQDEISVRSPSEVADTMSRAMEILKPESKSSIGIAEALEGLAAVVDFDVLMVKENSQSRQEANTHDKADKPGEDVEEIEALYVHEVQKTTSSQPDTSVETLQEQSGDLSRLHPGSNNWICLCTENKESKGERGKWTEYWLPANRVQDGLAKLRLGVRDLDEFNVYVSQLEFSERRRKVEYVAAFRACFVDIDGKIAGGDLTAEEWKNLILKFCHENKIPIPSEMVFSGNGVHVKYFFDRLMTRKEFSRWESLERKLAEIFKEIGADSHATDGARVLRVEGTKNCKPDTKDREVRVIFIGENYDFEKFARKIEALLPDEKVSKPEAPKSSMKSEKPTSEQKPKKSEPKQSEGKSEQSQTAKQPSNEDSGQTWFYILNTTTGGSEWVLKSELNSYLKKQDKTHRVKCSIVEYTSMKKREDRAKFIKNIYFSHVVLTNCLGGSLEEQISRIREYCRAYRGVGIPEPNRILEDGNKLILIWRYSKETSGQELPGIALPRWRAAQECLTHYFEDLGATNLSSAQKSTTLLPLAGFSSVKVVYEAPDLKYLFDDVATAVLPFTQEEVEVYEAEKKSALRRSIKLEELTAWYVERRNAEGRKSRFNPALKIFNDIVRLLLIRALNNNESEEVPEGRRELSVFWALDFAVQAGLVKQENKVDFNELAQKLINLCGRSFTFECTADTMTTLREKFLSGRAVYRPKKKTLINRLEITPEEQAELDILKNEAPMEVSKAKKQSRKRPVYENLRLPKSTYYRRIREAKQAAEEFRTFYIQYLTALWILEKLSQDEIVYTMRHRNAAYYESEGKKSRGGASKVRNTWEILRLSLLEKVVRSKGNRSGFDMSQELERPPPEL